MRWLAAIVFSSVLLSDAPSACELPQGVKIVEQQSLRMGFRFNPSMPSIGQLFRIDLWVCDESRLIDAGRIKADARMPAHGHGMNYRPEEGVIKAGKSSIDGFLLHMPGHWRFRFVVHANNKAHQLDYDFMLEP